MGFPSPAADYMEERIRIEDVISGEHSSATFYFRCSTDALVPSFIPPGAILQVNKALSAKNGSIVVASINGILCLRQLQKNQYKTKLIATNKKYPDIELQPGQEWAIWGVVTKVIINTA
jgi:DNA polymerase V